ncbi:subtilisin-like protease SBT2.6, partial [Phalaenopsis equestris]|uniref:subtilisin-like protease SBT2.6 n=1 Tax=Phalaenopsis equestris TaxID=78828 RepID=UPI0009E4106F
HHLSLSAYLDYINFLCSIPGVDPQEVSNITSSQCNATHGKPSDLNTPSITISHLVGTQTVKRTVTNVAETETYVISTRMSPEIALDANPPAMTVLAGSSKAIWVSLTVRSVTGRYSFGEVLLKGDKGHFVRIPVVAMGFSS